LHPQGPDFNAQYVNDHHHDYGEQIKLGNHLVAHSPLSSLASSSSALKKTSHATKQRMNMIMIVVGLARFILTTGDKLNIFAYDLIVFP
jgi:hypothetical protein